MIPGTHTLLRLWNREKGTESRTAVVSQQLNRSPPSQDQWLLEAFYFDGVEAFHHPSYGKSTTIIPIRKESDIMDSFNCI